MVAAELMTKDPATVKSSTTVDEAAQKMRELNIRHLPIIHAGQIVGVISDRDLTALLYEDLMNLGSGDGGARLNQAVGDVMSGDVLTAGPETEATELIELFIEHKIGAIPIVDTDGGSLLGIVSYVDILRAAADLFL